MSSKLAIASPTLARLRDARQALAEARTFGDVHKVLQQAAAMREVSQRAERYYQAQHVATEAITAAHACTIEAAEIETEAKAKAGEILTQMRKDGARRAEGRPANSDSLSLNDLGLSNKQASRWQSVGAIPKRTREQYYKQEKADPDGAISTGGLIKYVRAQDATQFEETMRSGADEPRLAYLDRLMEIVGWTLKIGQFDPAQAATHADEMLDKQLHGVADIWGQWLGAYDACRKTRLRSVK